MHHANPPHADTATTGTAAITRGVCRLFSHLGFAPITEFTLRNGRRVDVMGIDAGGRIWVAEVKSCLADFRADGKWEDYLGFCDNYFFAVNDSFPREVLPANTGLIVADGFGGAIVREAPPLELNASRRRAMLLAFARTAAFKLVRQADPDAAV